MLFRSAVDGDLPGLKTTLSATLRLVFLLTVPAAVWLAVLAAPVIALLYEHGRFGPLDTGRTAGALVMYCVGLPAFAAVGVLTRAFYALGDTRTPVRASFVAVALNLALNLLFIGPLRPLGLEHAGLALATSAAAIANLLQLTWYLRRRVGPLEGGRMLDTVWRVAVAAGLGGALCVVALRWLGDAGRGGLIVEAAVVAGGLLLASVAGYGAMKVLGVAELATVERLAGSLLRRLSGR